MNVGEPRNVSVWVDDLPWHPGKRVHPGDRRLRITATDAEPLEVYRFIWLGVNNLGELKLERSKGSVEATITPRPIKVDIVGEFINQSAQHSPATFHSLPIGRYRLKATFDNYTEEWLVEVSRNKTTSVNLKAPIGTLVLSSKPSSANFRLTGPNRQMSGKTPAFLKHLPAGRYAVQSVIGDYQKEAWVDVKPDETNEIGFTFEYGEVVLTTVPSAATIFLNNKELGQTPRTITDLKPGAYELRLERDGYLPVSSTIALSGNASVVIETNLLSREYVGAMFDARKFTERSPPEFDQALLSLEKALREKPGDSAALELKERLFSLRSQAERDRKMAEEEARKRFAAATFQRATEAEKDAQLWERYNWKVAAPLEKVRGGLVAALEKPPVNWQLDTESKVNEDNILFRCKGKGSLGRQHYCVILLSKNSPAEVHVYAQFWERTIGLGLSLLKALSVPNPNQPTEVPLTQEQSAAVDVRRKAIVEAFIEKWQNEIK